MISKSSYKYTRYGPTSCYNLTEKMLTSFNVRADEWLLQTEAHSSDPDAKRHRTISPSKSATLE